MGSVKSIQRVYYLALALFWLGTALPLALLVLLIQSRGLDLFQVGLLMGAYSLTVVLLEVPTGGLADAVGRKRVALLAYSLGLVSGIVFLFSFSFPAFLLGWILAGVARALSSGALDAWFVDALQEADPQIELQPALAKAGTVTLLALGAGTLLGGLIPRLFSSLPAEGTAVLTPLSMTVVFAGLVEIILLIVVALLVKEPQRPAASGGWRQGFSRVPGLATEAFGLSRRNPTILLLLGTTAAAGLALATVESFWQPRFAQLLGGAADNSLTFGAIMAGSFLFGVAGNLLSMPLSRLLKERYALVAALFQGAQGLFLLLLALQAGPLPAVLLFWLVYLNLGGVNSPQATLINQEIPAERRSTMLSVQSLAGYAGSILGSVLLGYLANRVSISAAWIVAGSILLVSLLLYLQIDARQGRQDQKNKTDPNEPETNLLESR
jgi:MFS family permease